jgi:hypothetical protein
MAILLALLLAASPAPAPALVSEWEARPPLALDRFQLLRGAYDGAAPAEAEKWREVRDYVAACTLRATQAAREALRPLGYEAMALRLGAYADRSCGAAQSLLALVQPGLQWEAFEAALREAWPVYAGYAAAVQNAERLAEEGLGAETAALAGARPSRSLGERLTARVVGEQVLRLALQPRPDAPSAALSPSARRILEVLLWDAVRRRDHANTDWLEREVARRGWPTVASAGSAGAEAAWLLVQHSDDDPAFQARMLKSMAPLAARGRVPKRDYALLYDRVKIKVSGRQRYGTQYGCHEGRFEPQPLEDPAKVDALRAEAGLDPLSENTARIAREYGGLCR